MLTEQQLAEIEARAAAATPGPWRWFARHRKTNGYTTVFCYTSGGGNQLLREAEVFTSPLMLDDNADFIAASRADVPAILADLRECRRLLGRLVACVDGEGDVLELANEVRGALGEDKP